LAPHQTQECCRDQETLRNPGKFRLTSARE
jgi:hypothetical protein